jgi:predicted RNase H-like nuclease (RuvC/YqgF family)
VHIESGDDEPVNDSFSNADGRSRPKLDPNRELAKDSVAISSHIQQLNNTIGALRSERMELTAQLRKNQLRIVHLENTVDQLSKQVNWLITLWYYVLVLVER